jgi:glycosyltransferase involved in cell wall biosynthesis
MSKATSTSRASCVRPRVLFVEGSTGFGGSGSILLSLLPQIDKSLFSIYIATYFPAHSGPLEKIQKAGIPYFPIGKGKPFEPWAAWFVTRWRNRLLRKIALLASWLYYWIGHQGVLVLRFYRLLRKEHIGAVVFNNDVHFHPAGIVAAKLAGKPILVRKGGGIGEGRAIKKLLTRWVDLFIPVSEATKADQAKSVGPERIELIYPGIDFAYLQDLPSRASARCKLGLPQDATIVGSASRLAEGKGQLELVLAAKTVLASAPDTFFCIAGDEDPSYTQQNLLKQLQSVAAQLEIAEHVVFLGWHDDVREVLAAIDVFVHCPTTFIEGLCLANLEAMACGLPTIVSRNGGLPDAVVDQVTGYIVEPRDVEALARAIVQLIKHPAQAQQMGEHGKQRAL